MKTKTIFLWMLLLMLVGGVNSVWADTTHELILNNGATEKTNGSSAVTVPQGEQSSTYFKIVDTSSSGAYTYTNKYNGYYESSEYSQGLKIQSDTRIFFTISPNTTATVTIVQATKTYDNKEYTYSDNNRGIKFGLSSSTTSYAYNSSVVTTPATSAGNTDRVRIYTFENQAAGDYKIERNDGECGLFYVKVEESDKIIPTLTFANGGSGAVQIRAALNRATYSSVLSYNGDGTVSYSISNNTAGASINSSTGEVTVTQAGSVRVTASATAGNNYSFGSAYYDLTVTKEAAHFSGPDNTIQSYTNGYTWDFATLPNYVSEFTSYNDWNSEGNNVYRQLWPDTYIGAVGFNITPLKGLRFQGGWLAPDCSTQYKYLYVSNGVQITIPGLVAGQTITINGGKHSGDGTLTISATNTSENTISNNNGPYTFTATGTSVMLSFSHATSINSISVSAVKSVIFDYFEANGKLLNQIDKPMKGNEVTHIFGGDDNAIRLTAACANDSYNTVEFAKGSTTKTSVKWEGASYIALSSDKAVIRKITFTLAGTPSNLSNFVIDTGGGSLSNENEYVRTWTGESSFVKFRATNNVDQLASIEVEYIERTPLSRFSPIGGTTTTFAYDAGSPSTNTTMIVNPVELGNTTDFEVAFTSNREVIAVTAGTAASSAGTGDNLGRVTFYNGVTRGKPGTADVYYRFKGNSQYSGMLAVVSYTINKADRTLSFATTAPGEQSYSAGGTYTNAASLSVGEGTINYSSSDTNVATVNSSGVVTFVNSGVTTITATTQETDYYNAATASYQLTVKGTQNYSGTITWDTSETFAVPGSIAYGDVDYVLATTTVEGKTVNYRSSDETVAKVTVESYGGNSNACKITPVSKGTVSIIAYIAGDGNTNPLENYSYTISIGGDNIKSGFYHGSGVVTQGKTLTPYVKVPNILLTDLTGSKITVTTSDATIATVGAGESATYGSSVELTEANGGILTEGGMIKAIYPTIYGVSANESPVTITMTFESSKYERTEVTYTVKVVSTDLNFAWAGPAPNVAATTEYTIYTGDYMMMPAISGNANGNWDYSKGTTCETKQAYLYGIRAGSAIWNYADFKVGEGYPNYRLTESSRALDSEQKTSMTNFTDKAYIVWASSQNTSDDTLMIYARQAGEVWLHAFDSQTKAELSTPIHITIIDKNTLADAVDTYVQGMTYPYTWDFTKDFTVTASPNYWEPHYNSSGTLDYYICGYSTMFNWDYCDQDNDGIMNEALGNVEAVSPYNKYFVSANSNSGLTNVMPQFYGMTIYSGNSGDTHTKSYETKRDKLRILHNAGEGEAHLSVVGGVHYLRLPNPATSNVIEGDNYFKLVIKARPIREKCTLYKFKNGDHSTDPNNTTATWKEITEKDEPFVIFDVNRSEMTGDNYIELGIDNVNIYWIAMSTEVKAINPASGATGDKIEMMATYSYDKAMDYSKSSEANGVDAYVATNVSIPAAAANPAITVNLNKANTSVPRGTGVVLRTQNRASSKTWTFKSWSNTCYSNGKPDSAPSGETSHSYSLKQDVDGLHLEANANGMAKIEECSVTVGDYTYSKRLNLLGQGGGTLGRRYVRFPVKGPTKITVVVDPVDAANGNVLSVSYGESQSSLTEAGTISLTSGAKSYSFNYEGTATDIYLFGKNGIESNNSDKTGNDGYGIRIYGITKTDKGATAYMIADAQNEQFYEAPSEPTINLLKGTGSGITIYQSAGNEICTTSGDSYIPFLFSSKYIYSETGETVHNAGYFSFWRVHGTSTTVGGNKAYLVLPTASYERVAEAWGKAADISGNMVDAASSRGISIRFTDSDEIIDDDNTTTIETVETNGVQDNDLQQDGGYYYNLKGMRTKRPYRGLYIINGKKIMVK